MNNQILNLLVVLIVTLCYLIIAIKFLNNFFFRISRPLTNAILLLYSAVLFGFGLTLFQFSGVATNAMYFYSSNGSVITGIWFWVLFSFLALGFSSGVFYFTFYFLGLLTQENEKAELAKNNFYIAALHSVVFILICLMVAKPLADLANSLVSYPKFPN
jgi:hypothetical protein